MYNKKEWQNDEIITAEQLNRIEDGIEAADGKASILTTEGEGSRYLADDGGYKEINVEADIHRIVDPEIESVRTALDELQTDTEDAIEAQAQRIDATNTALSEQGEQISTLREETESALEEEAEQIEQIQGWVDNQELAMSNIFDKESDGFMVTSISVEGKTFSYTSSTFSGWSGSIGRPPRIVALRFKVKARTTPIRQIQVFLTDTDKTGTILAQKLLNVNIPENTIGDIVWSLSIPIENTENKALYFTYCCDQFCDYWDNGTATIPPSEPQSTLAYTTNGRLLSTPAGMSDVTNGAYRYMPIEFGESVDLYVPNDNLKAALGEEVNVFLPKEYLLTVGDNFQLFYRGVILAVDPYKYAIQVRCIKGKAYSRYFEWTPGTDETGSFPLTVSVLDNNGRLLGTGQTVLKVRAAVAPSATKNILCIGDSLTAGGYWQGEGFRRFCQSGGTPAGLNLSGLNFIGTVKKTVGGVEIGYEGYGGWTWQSFCGSSSPFYDADTNDISFSKYCTAHSYSGIDEVYFLLTWNGQGTPYKDDFNISSGHLYYAKKLIDTLHREYPNAVVRCLGIQINSITGGMGYNYGANGGYSDTYGIVYTAFKYNKALEDFCNSDEYKTFVKYIDTKGQFDTEYNMPWGNVAVNSRSATTERRGSNGVHPSQDGYLQIGDAFFRSLCHDF